MRSLHLLLLMALASCGPSPSGIVYVYVECPTCACTVSWPAGDTVVQVREAAVFDKVFTDTLDYQVRLGDLPDGAHARLSIHQGTKLVYSLISPTKQGADTMLAYTGRTWRSWAKGWAE